MSRDTTVIPFRQPDAIDDPLSEVAREGARRMLAQVLIAEAELGWAHVEVSPQDDGGRGGAILEGGLSSCSHGNTRHRVTKPDPHEHRITAAAGPLGRLVASQADAHLMATCLPLQVALRAARALLREIELARRLSHQMPPDAGAVWPRSYGLLDLRFDRRSSQVLGITLTLGHEVNNPLGDP